MPELPEVETIARRLSGVLPGRVIKRIHALNQRSLQGNAASIAGQKIREISRRAKQLRIHLSGEQNLLIHLKMTGQLLYRDQTQRLGGGHPTADWVRELPSPHTRVLIDLDHDGQLFFNDQRLFGWIKVLGDHQVELLQADLALDINDPRVNAAYMWSRIHRRAAPIKQLIMNPEIVAGVGNIYACDGLFVAGISPWRPGNTLSETEVAQLVAALQQVIDEGIARGGTTFDGAYVNVAGFAGSYQEVARVYGRSGLPCQRCGALILKEKQAGRGTYFCHHCQL